MVSTGINNDMAPQDSSHSVTSTPAWRRVLPGSGLTRQFIADLAVGAVSSAVMSTCVYPIHRIKVVMQTQDSNPWVTSGKIERYDLLRGFGRLHKEQGILSLWRGNIPYLLRHMPNTSVSFAMKDAFRSILPQYDPNQNFAKSLAVNITAGSLAGASAVALLYPLDFMTIKMAADLGPTGRPQFGHTMRQVLQQTAFTQGIASMYNGLGVALTSVAAYRGLYFGIFDTVKPVVFPQDSTPPTFLSKWMLAQACVWTAVTCTYPLDVLRKRLIIDAGCGEPQYTGLRDIVKKIWRREGFKGFYRFYGFDMMFRFGGGLLLVIYDDLKSFLDSIKDGSGDEE